MVPVPSGKAIVVGSHPQSYTCTHLKFTAHLAMPHPETRTDAGTSDIMTTYRCPPLVPSRLSLHGQYLLSVVTGSSSSSSWLIFGPASVVSCQHSSPQSPYFVTACFTQLIFISSRLLHDFLTSATPRSLFYTIPVLFSSERAIT